MLVGLLAFLLGYKNGYDNEIRKECEKHGVKNLEELRAKFEKEQKELKKKGVRRWK